MRRDGLQLPDIKALVSFGKMGMEMMASRMLSLLALVGVLALSVFVVHNPSVIGAVVLATIAVAVFIPALMAESKGGSDDKETQRGSGQSE